MKTTYTTNNTNKDLNAFNQFRNANGNGLEGFENAELAKEFSTLKLKWWGSNLVFLGIEEKEGRFYPAFNVFD